MWVLNMRLGFVYHERGAGNGGAHQLDILAKPVSECCMPGCLDIDRLEGSLSAARDPQKMPASHHIEACCPEGRGRVCIERRQENVRHQICVRA